MALWEYKVITSGPHGFASPALLEAHLNALGKDEWEIIHFQTLPNNSLAFNGLARRSTMRDWSPPVEVPAASPARPPAEPVTTASSSFSKSSAPAAQPSPKPEPESLVSRLEEKTDPAEPVREVTLRPMRDTERDLDPDAEDEDEDWDNWEEEDDDLPTFFEAIKPHLRRNQKGPGMSVAVDYLAKRWEQRESDLVGALKECGFTIPETEEADPDYFEFEGDLYWVNRNNRGQLFINTREKPRPVFRTAPVKKLSPDDPATAELASERAAERAEIDKRNAEKAQRAERQAQAQAAAAERAAERAAAAAAAAESGPAVADQPDSPTSAAEMQSASKEPSGPMPAGSELLEKIRPMMRRNRRGPGYSGSINYLARGLKQSEADLISALASLGLNIPGNPSDKPVYVEIGQGVYWMNKDSRGGVWINGREKREGGQRPDKNGGQAAGSTAGGEQAAAGEQAAGTPESSPTSSAPGETAAPPTEKPAEPPAPAGEPVATMSMPEPAADQVPEREIVARAAEVTSAPEPGVATPSTEGIPAAAPADKSEANVSSGESKTEDAAASGAASSEENAEGERPAKAKGRRPSRPRTRKPKAETESGSGAAPETETPAE